MNCGTNQNARLVSPTKEDLIQLSGIMRETQCSRRLSNRSRGHELHKAFALTLSQRIRWVSASNLNLTTATEVESRTNSRNIF